MLNKVRGAALTGRLNALLAERGIKPPKSGELKPATVTVYAPLAVVNRLAHAEADRLIANNLEYAERCARLDPMLAGMPSDPLLDILTND